MAAMKFAARYFFRRRYTLFDVAAISAAYMAVHHGHRWGGLAIFMAGFLIAVAGEIATGNR